MLGELGKPENSLYLSVASVWEIGTLYQINRLRFLLPEPPEKCLETWLSRTSIKLLPIEFRHAIYSPQLPFHHKDPWDRMIISQAICDDFKVVTPDGEFKKYPVKTLWL